MNIQADIAAAESTGPELDRHIAAGKYLPKIDTPIRKGKRKAVLDSTLGLYSGLWLNNATRPLLCRAPTRQ